MGIGRPTASPDKLFFTLAKEDYASDDKDRLIGRHGFLGE
jgi:hypothetical protein